MKKCTRTLGLSLRFCGKPAQWKVKSYRTAKHYCDDCLQFLKTQRKEPMRAEAI